MSYRFITPHIATVRAIPDTDAVMSLATRVRCLPTSKPLTPPCRGGDSREVHDARAKCGNSWCSGVVYRPDSWPLAAEADGEAS